MASFASAVVVGEYVGRGAGMVDVMFADLSSS